MFVKCSLELPVDLSTLRLQRQGSVQPWLHALTEDARTHSRGLQAEAGLELPPRRGALRLEVDEPVVEDTQVSIRFHVWVEGSKGGWPNFDSVVTAAWRGDELTQLELTGQYEPPEGLSQTDKDLLHRMVEALPCAF